ncbi:hypothetical protein [Paramaledivibacter caminithermalis]|uniref:hypothetical protein n=1 Tax=Paramaledivibacter caminithermalis TaxID=191027 RepID=UPI0009324D92|nr:hypothetical protein [Paramaledivibacter caminithermalis]
MKTQSQLAEEFGIKQHQLSKYKKLQQLIPITLSRCIIELERLYGVKNGRPEKSCAWRKLKIQSHQSLHFKKLVKNDQDFEVNYPQLQKVGQKRPFSEVEQ